KMVTADPTSYEDRRSGATGPGTKLVRTRSRGGASRQPERSPLSSGDLAAVRSLSIGVGARPLEARTYWAVAFSFRHGGLLGALAGLYPAVRAARLSPAAAL